MAGASFVPQTVFFINKVLCSKMKAGYFAFPDLFSAFCSKILVISPNVGQFCQSLGICRAFQRVYSVELFVPCVYNATLLVTKQTKTTLEKGVTQCILLSLRKSLVYGKLSGLALKSKDSVIFWDAVAVVSGWAKHAEQHAHQREQQLCGSSVAQCVSWTVKFTWRGSVSEFQAWKESDRFFSFLNRITFVLVLNYQGHFTLHFSLICGQKLIWKRRT